MRALPIPSQDDDEILAKVVAHYAELMPLKASILASYHDYLESAGLSMIPVGIDETPKLALGRAYKYKARAAGLDWIKDIQSAHSLNFCPLCGGVGVRTIDHHLPFSAYPEFAAFSKNLLPSCAACNAKRNAANGVGSLTTLHSYFDQEVLSEPLIYTAINPPFDAPKFHVRRISYGDAALRWRVRNHVRKSLDIVAFRTWTAGTWIDVRTQQVPRHKTVDSLRDEVRETLQAESTHGNKNSWNASLLRGLLKQPNVVDWLFENSVSTGFISDSELGI